jgi:multidrug efflux pump subunit AcrB
MISLFRGFLFALFGIFLILATIFRSYLQPLIIMVTVPFGLIGAVLGHMVLGIDLSMMSLFGLVALTGIVVNDAIVLIESVNTRIKTGMPFFEALAQGGKRRFRAIVLTTITTCAGLLPIIIERSVQAQYLIPMAVTISSGVFIASFLTLILVPCIMGIMNDLRLVFFFLWHGRFPKREEVEPGFKRQKVEAWVEGA